MPELSTEVEDYLRRAQAVGDYLLRVLAASCDAAGTRYFLTSGTLLGAVRHEDWIPWDDDIDITMPRDDYERWSSLVSGVLPDDVVFSSRLTRRDHITPIPRLLHTGSRRIHVGRTRANQPIETRHVPLDVFILDRGPRSYRLRQFWSRGARALDLAATARYTSVRDVLGEPGLGAVRRMAELVVVVLARVLGHRQWALLRRAWVRLPARLGARGPLMATNYATPGGRRMSFEERWYFPASEVTFGGRSFAAPADPAAVLTELYGPDFLTPPPPADRAPIHLRGGLDVDLDELTRRSTLLGAD